MVYISCSPAILQHHAPLPRFNQNTGRRDERMRVGLGDVKVRTCTQAQSQGKQGHNYFGRDIKGIPFWQHQKAEEKTTGIMKPGCLGIGLEGAFKDWLVPLDAKCWNIEVLISLITGENTSEREPVLPFDNLFHVVLLLDYKYFLIFTIRLASCTLSPFPSALRPMTVELLFTPFCRPSWM